jgi:hypothetical protein
MTSLGIEIIMYAILCFKDISNFPVHQNPIAE